LNKKKLLEIIAAKEARKTELLSKVEKSEKVEELRSIKTELEGLNGEITELRAIADQLPDDPETASTSSNPAATDPLVRAAMGVGNPGGQPQGKLSPVAAAAYGLGNNQRNVEKELHDKWEQRGADLKARKSVIFEARELAGLFPNLEKRAVSIATSNLVAEQKYSDLLVPMFPQVSSLVDLVNVISLQGGEGYTQGFEVSATDADYTDDEISPYNEADPVFDKVSIGKAKITAYTELTDEARKLTNVDYQSRVAALISTSIRKKVAKEILVGTGAVNRLTGIYNAPANVMPVTTPNVDLTIAAIDENTLDQIVYSFGGDEAVEGGQWLILSKADLAAFAAIRATTGQKLYQIKLQGLVGTISSDNSYAVNFVINSAAPALSNAGTASGAYTLAYGSPSSYEMPVFSQIEVMESMDFKFSSGQMAFRGDVWLGGNVAKYRGFTRVKKA
jgi:HK97 family phage major capsid protein